MTVAELRAALDALPPEAAGWTVLLYAHAEPSPQAYQPVQRLGPGCYVPWNDVRGDFYAAGALYTPNSICLFPLRSAWRADP